MQTSTVDISQILQLLESPDFVETYNVEQIKAIREQLNNRKRVIRQAITHSNRDITDAEYKNRRCPCGGGNCQSCLTRNAMIDRVKGTVDGYRAGLMVVADAATLLQARLDARRRLDNRALRRS